MAEEQCEYGYTGPTGITWRCMKKKHGPKTLPAGWGSPERVVADHALIGIDRGKSD